MNHNVLGELEKAEKSPGLYYKILKRPKIWRPQSPLEGSGEGMCVVNKEDCLKSFLRSN